MHYHRFLDKPTAPSGATEDEMKAQVKFKDHERQFWLDMSERRAYNAYCMAGGMKQLAENLEGKALDWALAKAMNADKVWIDHGYVDVNARFHLHVYEPFNHTDPAVCLWLIKEYRASIDQVEHDPKVQVTIWYEITDSDGSDFDAVSAIGDTLEQAVARCVVQMRLGDEVDVPDELVGEKS